MNPIQQLFQKGSTLPAPAEVLYEFEEPLIFVHGDVPVQSLWYKQTGTPSGPQYWVVPTSDPILTRLKSGRISMLDALRQPWASIIEIDRDQRIVRTEPPKEEDEEFLPNPGTMLYAELQPWFSVRFLGENLDPGAVPASIAELAFKMGRKSLRKAAELAIAAAETQNLKNQIPFLKSFQNLSFGGTRFASFQVDFTLPIIGTSGQPGYQAAIENITGILDQATRLLTEENAAPCPPEELIEVGLALCPPLHGVVEQVELGGRLLSNRKIPIDRAKTRQMKNRASSIRENWRTFQATGRIRDFDKDLPGFTLREVIVNGANHSDIDCEMDEEFYDDAYDCFHNDLPCEVSLAARSSGKAKLLSIQQCAGAKDA